jgi:hypothetical protein
MFSCLCYFSKIKEKLTLRGDITTLFNNCVKSKGGKKVSKKVSKILFVKTACSLLQADCSGVKEFFPFCKVYMKADFFSCKLYMKAKSVYESKGSTDLQPK